MGKYYRINEMAKITSISVRTLHYYDEINLLNPSHRTKSAHRLYAENDLLKLQQIMTLKFMGFSLTKIKNLLNDKHFNIQESLKIQANSLTEEAARIEKVSKLLWYLIDHFDHGGMMDWESIIKIIGILQTTKSDKRKWYEKYLTQSESREYAELCNRYPEEYWINYHKRWADLFQEVKQRMHTNPESKTGLQLARKWLQLIREVHKDHNTPLSKKLWNGYKAGIIPQNEFPYDQEIITYITKAIEELQTMENK